jgi:hypothetical protein
MADSVNRIIPTSLPLDPTTPLGKEKKRRGDSRRQPKQREEIKPPPQEDQSQSETEQNQTKGKKLDISA